MTTIDCANETDSKIDSILFYISNVITMANCIKLKLLGLDERDVQLTKRQYFNTTAATSTSAVTINAATVTTITTTTKGMKVKFSEKFIGWKVN